ncbi:MAG: DUF4397 domain-containing protein [Burkholderiaceae bacterium]
MRLKTWAALAAVLTLPILNGCGDENAQKGFVRIVNATTEYASLDLYTLNSSGGNDLVVSGTAPNTASAYQDIDKGSYTFEVTSSTSAGAPIPAIGSVSKTNHFSVVTYLTGTATRTQFLSDEEAHPANAKAKLRVFNAATSEAPSVDVYLITSNCSALAVTDTAFATAVTGLQTTFTQVTASSAGTAYHACVFAAGDNVSLLLDIPALKLKDQEIATLILTHTAGGVLLNGAVLDQQGAYLAYPSSLARVRVVADAQAAAQVSVTVNGTTLANGTPSPSVGDYTTVAVGALNPTITIDTGTATGFTSLPATAAGGDYTLLVTGNAGAPAATLITDTNTPSTSTTNTVRARVINGLNGTNGSVSVTIDGKPIGSANFGLASSYTNILPSSGTSSVHATTTGVQPVDLNSKTFSAGTVNTVFVYGDASAPVIAPVIDR